MTHYQHSINIAASPAAVYAALTTLDGLQGWWSQDSDGSSAVGDTLHFRFGACSKDMLVERLDAGREVRWRCTRAVIIAESVSKPDEWVGTEPVFRLSADGQGGTRLDFEHLGLAPTLQCFNLCVKGWEHFLASLKQYVETGEGTPYILVPPPPSTPAIERKQAA
ncbi:MAG: SRPBCC domain-containing protein [Massilia sp.]